MATNRYRYHHMTHDELSEAINELGLSVRDVMRLTGASRLTVEQWLHPPSMGKGGSEEPPRWVDIPHSIAVMLALLRLPSGLDEAWRITDERIIPNAPATPYRGKE